MFDLEQLKAWVGPEKIESARHAMDMASVNGFRLDKRGRIEGGIKPAPPSTEAPSYVRITKRGAKASVDCRHHGRGDWCLHAVILALHHLGQEPIYNIKKDSPKNKQAPRIGFALCAAFSNESATFRILSLSTGNFVSFPRGFLARERKALHLSPENVELLTDLSPDDPDGIVIPRDELAPILDGLWEKPLQNLKGKSFSWQSAIEEPPSLNLSMTDSLNIRWHAEPALVADTVYAPGWPGFLIRDQTIFRCPGYVADFQDFPVGESGRLPISEQVLQKLLRQRHNVYWRGKKPFHLRELPPVSLRLEPNADGLSGQLGVVVHSLFFPLASVEKPLQLLRQGDDLALLDVTSWPMLHLGKNRESLRAPWTDDSNFTVRDHQAERFLNHISFPEDWQIERSAADRWFGIEATDMDVVWDESGHLAYRVEGETFSHEELWNGLRGEGRGVTLQDGRRLAIDTHLIKQHQSVIEGVHSLHDQGPRHQALLRQLLTGETDLEIGDEESPTPLPEHWQRTLRDYQSAGVSWLLQRFQYNEPALLADDMGLGKTIQTLAFLECVRGDLPTLIVVPTSLIANWREETAKFSPSRGLTIHHGPKRTREPNSLTNADLVITSYGTLRRDIDLLYDIEWQVVVLDEAQAIKNPDSQVAKAACELWSHQKVALTGTPVENRLKELWSIFQFMAPGYLGEAEDLKAISTPGTPGFEALRLKVKPFLMRRLKSEVAPELPERQTLTVKLPLSNHQRQFYEQIRRGAREAVGESSGNTMSILTQLLRLRQACCHPGLVDQAHVSADAVKLEYLIESLLELESAGHAALVFSQFTQLLKLTRFALEKAGIDYLYLDGQTKNRQDLVHRFQKGEATVFLISLKAGGTGLNLTRASYVYHLDPWWNPMAEAQATDRAHRIGQTQKVISYKLIAENTVEERILKLQANKKFLAEGLWHEPDKLIATLDKETLLQLL